MTQYFIPYHKTTLGFNIPDEIPVDIIAPQEMQPAPDPVGLVETALENPVAKVHLNQFGGVHSAIAKMHSKLLSWPYPCRSISNDLGVHMTSSAVGQLLR